MPQAQNDPRGKPCFPLRVGGDDTLHEREKAFGVVEDLDVDVELDVLVLGLHEEGDYFGEGGDGLGGLFGGANVFHAVGTVPIPIFNISWMTIAQLISVHRPRK